MTGRGRSPPVWFRATAGLGITAAIVGILVLFGGSPLFYLWVKAFHVIAVIAWMAGMLYLPRLFVYHCEAQPGSRQSETFKLMEQRLLNAIINPAMVVTWALGVWLAWDSGFFTTGWLQAKILLVVVLSGMHGFLVRYVRDFAADQNRRSQRFYRIINEVPTALMVGIVILVIVRPF